MDSTEPYILKISLYFPTQNPIKNTTRGHEFAAKTPHKAAAAIGVGHVFQQAERHGQRSWVPAYIPQHFTAIPYLSQRPTATIQVASSSKPNRAQAPPPSSKSSNCASKPRPRHEQPDAAAGGQHKPASLCRDRERTRRRQYQASMERVATEQAADLIDETVVAPRAAARRLKCGAVGAVGWA